MRQSELHGQARLLVVLTAVSVGLISLAAGAANYYAPPEYAVPQGTTIIHAGT